MGDLIALGNIASLLLGYYIASFVYNKVRGRTNKEAHRNALTGVEIVGIGIAVLSVIILIALYFARS